MAVTHLDLSAHRLVKRLDRKRVDILHGTFTCKQLLVCAKDHTVIFRVLL